MKRPKPVTRFIVFSKYRPLTLCKGSIAGAPRAGVLMYALVGTLFVRRDTARRAINRTIKFAKEHNYPAWLEGEHHIFPVTTRVDKAETARRLRRKINLQLRTMR